MKAHMVTAVAVLVVGSVCFAAPVLQEGVRIEADGKPIDVAGGHLVPCAVDWNADGKKDLVAGQYAEGKVRVYLNGGTDAAPALKDSQYLRAGRKVISLATGRSMGAYPQGVDWNADGKVDLIAGDGEGGVWLFLNVGEAGAPKLAAGTCVAADSKDVIAEPKASGRSARPAGRASRGGAGGTYRKVHVADWDADGLKDLLVGHSYSVTFCKNVGTPAAPRLAAPVTIKVPGGKFPLRSSPCLADWDGDGKQDLLVGYERSKVYFFRNMGTPKAPRLAAGKVLALRFPDADVGYRYAIDVVDWNNDGRMDLLVGNFASPKRFPGRRRTGGNIWLFLRK